MAAPAPVVADRLQGTTTALNDRGPASANELYDYLIADATSRNNRAGSPPPTTFFIGASSSFPIHTPISIPFTDPMNHASR